MKTTYVRNIFDAADSEMSRWVRQNRTSAGAKPAKWRRARKLAILYIKAGGVNAMHR